MIHRLTNNRLFRFAAIGAAATVFQYLLLALFVEQLGMVKVLASACSFALSALGNYWLNYRLTFASTKAHRETLPKFAATAAIGLGINTLSFALLLGLLPHYLIAQIAATAITLAANYLLHKHWIYRNPL